MKIKKFNQLYESIDINKLDSLLLNEEKSVNALIDGYCILFGEKYRDFLTRIGKHLVEIGKENGKKWILDSIKYNSRLDIYFEEGYFDQDKKDKIKKDLKLFLSVDELDFLLDGNRVSNDHPSKYSKGFNHYIDHLLNTIDENDINIVKIEPFNYFKQFGLSNTYDSITLYSEGGFGLDILKKKSLEYYKKEGELFYIIESIAYKFHYLGMLLQKEYSLKDFINRCMKLNKNTNYAVCSFLSNVIYELSREPISDDIIIYIQNNTGLGTDSGFLTHKQIEQKIKQIRKK